MRFSKNIDTRPCLALASIATLLFATAAPLLASPEIPGAVIKEPVALIGGTVHTVSGKPIVGGTLVFHGGKIVAVGKKVKIPANAKKIDVKGKHVYPGLIESYTDIGLTEINAVRATRDQREVGQLNPNVRAQVAFNPDSELIPVARANGVLLALSTPQGGLISGQSALMCLDGWTYEDMALLPAAAMHVDWPRMSPISAWWSRESNKEQLADRDKALKQLDEVFAQARAYRKAKKAGTQREQDLRFEAMLPVLARKQPLVVSADDIQQIQAAVAFAQRQKVKLIVLGGYDAPRCAALLKKYEVPVIVAGVHRLPRRRGDDYDAPFTVPERLRKAGVRFCISGRGRFSAANVRNLPYHAGTASAHGLPPAEALRAITLYPAKILGVADRVGSLEQGKHATLIVTDGDILETPTQVLSAYIQGRPVSLNNRHKRLWEKYKEKYRRQEK